MVRNRFPHRRRQTSAEERERLKEKEVLQRGIKLSPRNSGNSGIRGQERARRMLRIGTISTTAIFVATVTTVTTVASMLAIFILALHFPCKQISLSCDGEE